MKAQVANRHAIHIKFNDRGFTLVEAMIAVAIMAIMLTIGFSGLQGFILAARMNAQSSNLVGAINLARSEAIKRNSGMTICKSADNATCLAAGVDWAPGWIIFQDTNFDGVVNAGETVFRAYPALSGNAVANSTGSLTQGIIFTGLGRPVPTFVSGRITICPPAGADQTYCRTVCVNSQGRPRVDTPAELAADNFCGN